MEDSLPRDEAGEGAGTCRRSRRRMLVVALGCLVAAAVLGVAHRDVAGFYLTFPSMSRAEFLDIAERARAGDPEAQLYYGVFHANGDGVRQDYAEAAKWYGLAAEQGNVRAERNLALLYECGIGVERDYQQAFTHYWKAADNGDEAANLGLAGFRLIGRERLMPLELGSYDAWRMRGFYRIDLHTANTEPEESFWEEYRNAARFSQDDGLLVKKVQRKAISDADASLRMALFYHQAQGVKKDRIQVEQWLRSAANMGDPYALSIVGNGTNHYEYSELIKNPPQLEYLRKAAATGKEDIFTLRYALALEQGTLERDTLIHELVQSRYVPALQWYSTTNRYFDPYLRLDAIRLGADHENGRCMSELAWKYALGDVVERDFNQSLFWMEKILALPDYGHAVLATAFFSKAPLTHNARVDGFIDMLYRQAKSDNTLSQVLITLSLENKDFKAIRTREQLASGQWNVDPKDVEEQERWIQILIKKNNPFGFMVLGKNLARTGRMRLSFSEETFNLVNTLIDQLDPKQRPDDLSASCYVIAAKLGYVPAQLIVAYNHLDDHHHPWLMAEARAYLKAIMARPDWHIVNVRGVTVTAVIQKYIRS